MRLYTGTGDDGSTGLFGGGRVSKDHPRVVAYGEADGLNAALGLAVAACEDSDLRSTLEALQRSVFQLGADLATPLGTEHEAKVQRIGPDDVIAIEAQIDTVDAANAQQRSFVLPGGSELAARLHVARDAARRALPNRFVIR